MTEQWTLRPFSRLRRVSSRTFAYLIECNPPRGVGTATVIGFFALSSAYGLVKGDYGATLATQMHDVCDGLANTVGLRINAITLNGNTQLLRDDILGTAGIFDGTSLLCLDAADARAKLVASPWIADATMLKLYPDRLQIDIKERTPLALWQKDGEINVIAADGTALEPFSGRFAELPLVVGQGADKQASELLTVLARYPALRGNVQAAVLVAERRWNLHLANGVDVRLPDRDIDAALAKLSDLDNTKNLLSRDITVVDLRLDDRVTVRLSDDAAKARTDAINAALKAAKAKRKGSDT